MSMPNSLTTSLDSLKNVLEALEQAENMETFNEEIFLTLAPELDVAMEGLKERVDARINFLEYCQIMESKFKGEIGYLEKKVKTLQNIQSSLKKHTMLLLEQNPAINFQGERKKFKIYNNGGKASLEWKATLQEIKNIVDPTEVALFPADMIKEVHLYALDKEKLEGYLAAGGTCEGVKTLPRGKHMRIV